MRTLSIRQPWAWLIVNGHKDIENRDWATLYRGPLLIHAGKTMTQAYHREVAAAVHAELGIEIPSFDDLQRGGVVGVATLKGCVRESSSPWFNPGGFGWLLRDARPLPFYACNGALSLFDVPAVAVGL